MQTSPTRLEKPLHIWLARILGFGIVLASIGTNLAALPQAWQKLQHEGTVQDFYYALQPDGSKTVAFVSSEAAQKGIAIGDRYLSPDDDAIGEIGTAVTLRVQRENAPVREVTFVRKPSSSAVWGGMLFGLSQETSTLLALLFVLMPVILGGIAALLIFWFRSDDWMALLTAILLTSFTAIPSSNPVVIIFRAMVAPLTIAWLLLFPNGKLAPRWSWVLLFFLWPGTLFYSLFELGVLSYDTRYAGATTLFDVLSTLGGLGIIGVLLFRYRRIFSPIERQQTKWIIVPLLVGLVPIVVLGFFATLYWNSYQIEKGMMVTFVTSAIGLLLSSLVILGALISIFRYRSSTGVEFREALASNP